MRALDELAEKYHIQLLYTFGSEARGDTHAGSDIDIAYQTKESLSYQQRSELARLLKTVLQVGNREIDLVDMKHLSPLMSFIINQEGKKMYGSLADDDRFFRSAIKRYIDAQPLFKQTEQYIHERTAL